MASSRALSIATLVLRLVALVLLAGSTVILATDKVTFSDGSKVTFKDVTSYRYVIATASIGFAHTLLQIPFAIFYVCTEKQMIRNQCLSEFDFYADKMAAFLLATGAATGIAVTLELKKAVREFLSALLIFGGSDIQALGEAEIGGFERDVNKFFNRAQIANGLLVLGFLCVALQSVISSIVKKETTRGVFIR